MSETILLAARRDLHGGLQERLWLVREGVPSNSDKDNRASVGIGLALAEAIGVPEGWERLGGSGAGTEFERQVLRFLQVTFPVLGHMRPGDWTIERGSGIANFEQYAHLSALERAAAENSELAAALGKRLHDQARHHHFPQPGA